MPLNDIYQSLNPVAFSIGPLSVRWYGLAYLSAFICAFGIMYYLNKRWKLRLHTEDIATLVIAVAFGAVLGGRLGYVIFYGNGYYLAHPLQVLALNEGGMSFHGGLIGALVAGAIACKCMRISFVTCCDLGSIAAPVGIFFGRLANFVNGELWGKVTNLPIGVIFPGGGCLPRHPSQLYEALLEGLLLFIILFCLARKKRPRGTYLGLFLVLYGIFRTLVEFVRVPDEQLGYLFGPVTMGMVLSLPLIICGILMLMWVHKHPQPHVGYVGKDAITKVGRKQEGLTKEQQEEIEKDQNVML